MSTLREQYTTQKLQSLKEHAAKADKRLHETRRRLLSEERALVHFARADVRLRAINEAKFDPQEAKQIHKTVKRLEAILGKMKSQGGELHNVSRLVSTLTQELSQFSGAGWWTKMLASMKDSRNPMTKAAALEGLLKGGMEAIEDILGTQGGQLQDNAVIADQGQAGKNIQNALAQAFDPGRISSLSALGGGKVSQLFGTKGSIGAVIAQDLVNITPAQLRSLSGAIRGMETVAPQEVTPQAAAAAAQDATQTQQPAAAPAPAPAAQDDVQLATPDSEPNQQAAAPAPDAAPDSGTQPVASIDTKTLQSKAGSYLSNMKVTLNRNEPKKALLHAVRALKALGINDLDTAVKMLQAPPAPIATPAKTG